MEVNGERIDRYTVTPDGCGLPVADPATVPGGDPQDNAATTRAILAGEPGPSRDIAVLNAAAAIYAAGRAESVADGVGVAQQAIDSGSASTALDRYLELSRTA